MSCEKKIVISGATGFIGQELGLALVRQGYRIVGLTRHPEKHQGLMAFPCSLVQFSDDNTQGIEEALEGASAVINLAGQPIDSGAWTLTGKKSIYQSRLRPLRLLLDCMARLRLPPPVFLQASAVGYYGKSEDKCDEEHGPGQDSFLAKVCSDLEDELKALDSLGCRYVAARFGVVLGFGGALEQINQIYAAGLGARFFGSDGFHAPPFPWVFIDDVVSSLVYLIEDEKGRLLSGPVNVVAPTFQSLEDLHKAMTGVHGWQFAPPAPEAIVRKIASKKSVLLFDNANVVAKKLVEHGFAFSCSSLKQVVQRLYPSDLHSQFRVVKKQFVQADFVRIWEFFSRPENLETITPGWLKFHLKSMSTEEIGSGTDIVYQLRIKGVPVTWKSKILDWSPPQQFKDVQVQGPYQRWDHTHRFERLDGGVLIIDDIVYKLPMGKPGALAAGPYVRKDIEKIFSYRANLVARALS